MSELMELEMLKKQYYMVIEKYEDKVEKINHRIAQLTEDVLV